MVRPVVIVKTGLRLLLIILVFTTGTLLISKTIYGTDDTAILDISALKSLLSENVIARTALVNHLDTRSEDGSPVVRLKNTVLELILRRPESHFKPADWAAVIDEMVNASTRDSEVFRVGSGVLEHLIDVVKDLEQAPVKNKKSRQPEERLNVHAIPDNSDEDSLPAWKLLQNHMSSEGLYSASDPVLGRVLQDLRTLPIADLDFTDRGTQVKMLYTLENGMRVISKPQKRSVEEEPSINTYYYDEFERFQSEVAAFHLDRILRFHRVPPVVSRYINLKTEIKDMAPSDWRKTFYPSIVGNLCFYGICDQFCTKPFAICGSPPPENRIATSFGLYLQSEVQRTSWQNPWRQSYSRHGTLAEWQTDPDFCEGVVRKDQVHRSGRRLLDLMDLATFDFFLGNLDRHTFHTLSAFGNDSAIFYYDSGRGFGRSYKDELDLLAPIQQCCVYRFSTLRTLLEIYNGDVTLGELLKRSLASEMVRPLILDKHLRALDRRPATVLKTVHKCIVDRGGHHDVIIDDGH